ncbi:MAG: hypothetical protein ACI976_000038 [Aureispira sp.]|jgi:hypothetical protein
MFVAKNTTTAPSPSSITNKGANSFIQPKLNVEKSGDTLEAEKATDQTGVKSNESSSSFFSATPASQKQSEEEIQTPEIEVQETENKQAVVEPTTPEVQSKESVPDVTTTKESGSSKKGDGASKGTSGGKKTTQAQSPSSKEDGNKKEENEAEKEVVELPTENTKIYSDALVSQSPIAFAKAVKKSDQNILKAQESEQNKLTESLPEIEQPTGIPLKSKAAAEKEKQQTAQEENNLKGEKETLPDTDPKGKKEGEKVEEKNVQPPSTLIEKLKAFFGFGRFGSDDDKKSKIRSGIKSLPTSESVDTNPGASPKVDLTGQADPTKNEDNTKAADTTVDKDQSKNLEESKVYRGEDDIYPEMEVEMLSPTTELSSIEMNTALEKEVPKVSSEVAQSFDTSAKAYMDQELAQGKAKQDQAFSKMETDHAQEHILNEQKIEQETNRVKKEQETSQQQAKGDVNKQRTDWKKENEGVKSEFSNKSAEKRKKVDKDIDTKTKDTDKKVDQEYSKAKKEGDKKVTAANKEAKTKKAKAKKESKKKSWWDRAVDAVSNFFDKLKEALNTLFDGLRKLVKVLIEAAKKLVNTLIDLARDAIVGLIKAFGKALKAFVNVALAAFPKLRDKFNAAIDKAVNKAVDVVNKLAEGLKKAVNALLDALGAVLDAILAAYQALYNLFLDILKFLTVGLLKVLEFLWNLVEGAWYAPGAFFGALAKEAIGGDPSKPLANFEVPQGQEDNWSKAMGLQPGQTSVAEGKEVSKQIPEQLQAILSKKDLSEDDIILEPNPAVELSPELLAQLSSLQNGEIKELGGAGAGAITTEEFQASAIDASGYDINSITDTSSEQANESVNTEQNIPSTTEDTGGSGPDWKSMSDDQKLNHYLGEMLKPNQEAGAEEPAPTTEKAQPVVDNSPEVLITKTGRLGVGERLAFMGQQMMTGLGIFWDKYKVWIISALVAALIAAGVVAFFTGGAGLALAVDIIVKAMIIIFGAIAVYKAMGHIWDYVKFAWAGDTKKAGESLATALAVIVVEFFIDKILLGMAKVFKRIKKAAKAVIKSTKAGRKVLAGATKVRRFAQTTIRKGVSKVKGSKLVVNMKKVVGKGAKKFDDLRNKILAKFGFDKMWFKSVSKYIELWASFNPKFRLLRTEKEVVADNRNSPLTTPQWKRMPDGSYKVKSPDQGWRNAEIIGKDPVPEWARGTKWEKYYLERNKINTSFTGATNADEQIHHLVTMENLKHPVTQKGVSGGYDINHAGVNGKKVRTYSSEVRTKKANGKDVTTASPQGVHSSHPNYTKGQSELLDKFQADFPGASDALAADFLKKMSKKLDSEIGKLTTDQTIDQLFKTGKYTDNGILDIKQFYGLLKKQLNP